MGRYMAAFRPVPRTVANRVAGSRYAWQRRAAEESLTMARDLSRIFYRPRKISTTKSTLHSLRTLYRSFESSHNDLPKVLANEVIRALKSFAHCLESAASDACLTTPASAGELQHKIRRSGHTRWEKTRPNPFANTVHSSQRSSSLR